MVRVPTLLLLDVASPEGKLVVLQSPQALEVASHASSTVRRDLLHGPAAISHALDGYAEVAAGGAAELQGRVADACTEIQRHRVYPDIKSL